MAMLNNHSQSVNLHISSSFFISYVMSQKSLEMYVTEAMELCVESSFLDVPKTPIFVLGASMHPFAATSWGGVDGKFRCPSWPTPRTGTWVTCIEPHGVDRRLHKRVVNKPKITGRCVGYEWWISMILWNTWIRMHIYIYLGVYWVLQDFRVLINHFMGILIGCNEI